MPDASKALPIEPAAISVLRGLLAERHSCRGFSPEPVPDATIEAILEMAQQTASWCNAQPWQVVVTRGRGTDRFRQALASHAASAFSNGVPAGEPDFPFPAAYEGVYQARRRDTGQRLYGAVGVERGDTAGAVRQTLENFNFFGAPHALVVTTEAALGPYGAIDCGGYVATLLLAAQGYGVATIPQAAIAMFAPFVRDYFGLPASRLVVCGISLGYEDTAHPANGFRTPRAGLSETVTWAPD